MASSFILDGLDRPNTPTWTRTNWKIFQAREAGLFPPSAPDGKEKTNGNISYDFTWHHNIPWNTLRNSFKIAIVFCDWDVADGLLDLYGMRGWPDIKKRIRLAREAIGPLLKRDDGGKQHSGSTHVGNATIEKWVSRYSDGPESLLEALSPEKQLTLQQKEIMVANVGWQPWNIVEGPKESVRIDDPGSDDFDDFSRADPANFHRYMAIQRLYHALEFLIKDYDAHKGSVGNEDLMKKWTLMLKGPVQGAQFLIQERLVMFDPEHWRPVRWGGKYHTKMLDTKEYYQVRMRQSGES